MLRSADAIVSRNSRNIAELLAKKTSKIAEAGQTAVTSAVDALKAHKERKDKPSKPKRTLEEIEDELLAKQEDKKVPFSRSKKDKFQLLNKRRAGRIIDSPAADKDDLEGPEPEDAETSGRKPKLPYHYSIPHQVLNAVTIEGWRRTKLYMIFGMLMFIGGVVGVSYYRGRNKMLLPGKLM